jgi:hypothetical protein
MNNLIHPLIFKALCSGAVWLTILTCSLITIVVLLCKYGNTNKEETCQCYRTTKNCNLCVTDKILISLFTISLALIVWNFLTINDRLNQIAIDCAKSDGILWTELTKQDIEKNEIKQNNNLIVK